MSSMKTLNWGFIASCSYMPMSSMWTLNLGFIACKAARPTVNAVQRWKRRSFALLFCTKKKLMQNDQHVVLGITAVMYDRLASRKVRRPRNISRLCRHKTHSSEESSPMTRWHKCSWTMIPQQTQRATSCKNRTMLLSYGCHAFRFVVSFTFRNRGTLVRNSD